MLRLIIAGMSLLLAAPAQAGLFGSVEYERPTPPGHVERLSLLEQVRLSNGPDDEPRSEAALLDRLRAVNDAVNSRPYLTDEDNYGVADHWATPAEFEARGGDCEDYAIAKYARLKALGLPVEQMRIIVVRDRLIGQQHAILSVAVGDSHYILDNQLTEVLPDSAIGHYRPIYSLNERSWWLHLPG